MTSPPRKLASNISESAEGARSQAISQYRAWILRRSSRDSGCATAERDYQTCAAHRHQTTHLPNGVCDLSPVYASLESTPVEVGDGGKQGRVHRDA